MKTYSTEEVAAILGISQVHVRRLCIHGHIRAQKVGRDWRITPAALKRYQEKPLRRGRPPKGGGKSKS